MTDEFEEAIRSRMGGESINSDGVVIERLKQLDTTVNVGRGESIGDGVLVDFNLTVNGVDEASGSRLVFNPAGGLLHGSLRAGEVDLNDGTTLDELERRWREMLTASGVRLNDDAVLVQMREVGGERYVPHIVFGSGGGGETSPIPTRRLLSIVRSLPDIWNTRTTDLQLRENIDLGGFSGDEKTVGSVEDMMDNL